MGVKKDSQAAIVWCHFSSLIVLKIFISVFSLSLCSIVKHCVILSNHRIPLPLHNSQVSGIFIIQFIFLWMLQSRQLGVFAIRNLDRWHVEKPFEFCWILHFKFSTSTLISEICLSGSGLKDVKYCHHKHRAVSPNEWIQNVGSKAKVAHQHGSTEVMNVNWYQWLRRLC